jgi:hypothetical protein
LLKKALSLKGIIIIDLCDAETSAASARAEERSEQDERAARGELGEDEEKQVNEGQARARAFRGRAVRDYGTGSRGRARAVTLCVLINEQSESLAHECAPHAHKRVERLQTRSSRR